MTTIFNKKIETIKRRILRNNMPLPEIVLWSRLRNKQLNGYRFRRQFSIGRYVVDFYCPALKLAIEIDGDSHFIDGVEEYDKDRQVFIESFGIKFLRFTNLEITNNLNVVLEKILQTCHYPHLISPLVRGRKRGGKIEIILLFFIFSFLFLTQANAAELKLTSQISEIGIGQQFQVDLMLDAEGQDINAVEGAINFSGETLELKEIRDGNSVVSFWIQKPAYVKGGGIEFSGVIPGGFSGVLSPYYKGGKPGKVFSVIFVAKKEGSGAIEIRDAKVLLNDGQGTPAQTTIFNFQFSIFKQIPDSKVQIPDSKKDIDPPELFTPEVASDPNVFDGKWFLVFAAQDKGSGIDYYAIHESARTKEAARINTKDWTVAESPYVLKDQKLRSYIYVKAVDKAGNARIVYLPPAAPWYKKWLVDIVGGLAGLVVLLLIVRWLWRKYKRI